MDHGKDRESWVTLIISIGIFVIVAALVFWGVVGGR
jgi:Na+/H+ antiporter NhaD/arsenite permease-like protein